MCNNENYTKITVTNISSGGRKTYCPLQKNKKKFFEYYAPYSSLWYNDEQEHIHTQTEWLFV